MIGLSEKIAEIRDVIHCYANVYESFEKLQNDSELLPKGDQKTGVIGEFYALLYAKELYKDQNKEAKLGKNHSQPVYDILVGEVGKSEENLLKDEENTIKIQVKTVSAYAEKRKTTEIKSIEKCTYLYVLSLDRFFKTRWFLDI